MPPVRNRPLDQACGECRRRKARCNKSQPRCDLCQRHGRSCLYEKPIRTPLTRKHLTEVETRLEKADALIQQMRSLMPAYSRPQSEGPQLGDASLYRDYPTSDHNDAIGSLQQGIRQSDGFSAGNLSSGSAETGFSISLQPPQDDLPQLQQAHLQQGDNAATSIARNEPTSGGAGVSREDGNDGQRMIDDPPLNDFEWCEREVDQHVHGLSPDAAPVHESPRSDGMASLSVAERETGYLGVASVAALLRLLDPRQDTSSPSPRTWRTPKFVSGRKKTSRPVLLQSPNPNRHISEAMIDAYFRLYHVHYPIIHEPTFRAQYSEVIHRPHGSCWTVLAYIVAAIGAWSSSSSSGESLDLALFSHARSMLDFNFLEVGNLSLVQALTLASNYQQKRDKPNSGYNYLGLAVRMAMGLGLHKEFQGWRISPLTMEIRRRVWWSLCVFDVGATITFSRPEVWPYKGVEVSLPLNVNDKDLTAATQSYPPESHHMTPYTAVATQARFHVATHSCYERVISKPQPSSDALLTLDAQAIEPWIADVPSYFAEDATVPHRYALSHAIKSWRSMNLRIIMYRPFVIRKMLKRSSSTEVGDMRAFHRCLDDVRSTINLISDYWRHHEHNFLTAWYSLYFLFQATLIPCICLRNAPNTSEVDDWRAQIGAASNTIAAMAEVNSSATRCHRIILNLCGKYLDEAETGIRSGPEYPSSSGDATDVTRHAAVISPEALADSHRMTGSEAPQASHNPMIGLMWPHVPPLDAVDMTMGDEMGWMDLLAGGGNDI